MSKLRSFQLDLSRGKENGVFFLPWGYNLCYNWVFIAWFLADSPVVLCSYYPIWPQEWEQKRSRRTRRGSTWGLQKKLVNQGNKKATYFIIKRLLQMHIWTAQDLGFRISDNKLYINKSLIPKLRELLSEVMDKKWRSVPRERRQSVRLKPLPL